MGGIRMDGSWGQTAITGPIDIANLKNIQNVIVLRKISFSIYQPLAMTAQYFILMVTLVFSCATYVLYASIYYTNTVAPDASGNGGSTASEMAFFYKIYSPS